MRRQIVSFPGDMSQLVFYARRLVVADERGEDSEYLYPSLTHVCKRVVQLVGKRSALLAKGRRR